MDHEVLFPSITVDNVNGIVIISPVDSEHRQVFPLIMKTSSTMPVDSEGYKVLDKPHGETHQPIRTPSRGPCLKLIIEEDEGKHEGIYLHSGL